MIVKKQSCSWSRTSGQIPSRFLSQTGPVLYDIGPIRNHQLIGFKPKGEQVSISYELRIVCKYFFIGNCLGVAEAASYGGVDCVDYISHRIVLTPLSRPRS